MTDLLERRASEDESRKMRCEPLASPPEARCSFPKVLMVGASPPPYYGSIVIFGRLMASPLRERFRLIQLDISDHRDVSNVGCFDLENVRLGIAHALACRRALKAERPDLVYVPVAQNPLAFFRDSLFLLLARRHGLRRVVHVHGGYFGEFYRRAPAPLRAYIRWTLKGVSAAVVNSQMLGSMFAGLLPDERVWPVPIGIEDIPAHFLAQPRPARRPTVLYFGTLIESKGFLDVMAAAPLVAQEIPGVRFVIAGGYFSPGDREKAERLLQDPAIRDRVELPGVISGDARFELLLDADVFAFPTYYPIEGQPAVLVEAMSAGLPVVTTDQGAIRETIVEGETGYLVPQRDPGAIARRVVELLQDEPLRRRMGEAGRRRFEQRFRVETYSLGMAQVFDAVLSEEL
jgi:glycosyltransferase involved in cell wall biosynthesis